MYSVHLQYLTRNQTIWMHQRQFGYQNSMNIATSYRTQYSQDIFFTKETNAKVKLLISISQT